MKPQLLFPAYFRVVGFVLALAGLILGYICMVRNEAIAFLDHDGNSLTKNFAATFEVTGLMFLGFSRLKNENEETGWLRLNALYWSVLVGFLLAMLGWVLDLIGTALNIRFLLDLPGLLSYYPFALLWVFTGRFYYQLSRNKAHKPCKPVYLFTYKPWLPAIRSICVFFFLLIIATENVTAIDDFIKKITPDGPLLLFPVSLVIWIWSKQKNETGMIGDIRLGAMQVAVYVNYILFLIATWYYYGLDYLFIEIYTLISIPILFLCIFYFRLFMLRKKANGMVLTDS
jgi:hypothetical protein